MNNPLGVSPSKGNQGTTRGEEKSFDLGGNRTYDLRISNSRSNPEVVGLFPFYDSYQRLCCETLIMSNALQIV